MPKMNKKATRKPKINLLPILLAVGLILLTVGAIAVFSQPAASPASQAYPAEISVAQAAEKRDAGTFILDVREPEEWIAGHIPNATLIPLSQLKARVDELPKDQEIVVVCRSGNRSAQGRDILRAAGLEQVTSMAGGMNQWQSAGYEVVTGP